MPSRSNKAARSMSVTASPQPRSYGAPTGYSPPSTATAAGRPRVGPGTAAARRAAIDADQRAAADGAKKMAAKRKTRQAQQAQQPGGDPATRDLSVVGAARKIREKKARDMEVVERAGSK